MTSRISQQISHSSWKDCACETADWRYRSIYIILSPRAVEGFGLFEVSDRARNNPKAKRTGRHTVPTDEVNLDLERFGGKLPAW